MEQYQDRLQSSAAWLDDVQTALDKGPLLGSNDLQSAINRLKATEGDLFARPGDLKGLSSSAHKFVSGVLHYETCVTSFRQRLGQETSYPLASANVDANVREAVRATLERHEVLADRCREMLAALTAAADQHRRVSDQLQRLEATLEHCEGQLTRLHALQASNRQQALAQTDKVVSS